MQPGMKISDKITLGKQDKGICLFIHLKTKNDLLQSHFNPV